MKVSVHECRGGQLSFDFDHAAGIDTQRRQGGAVVGEVFTDCAHERRRLAKQAERVGNVAADAAALLLE